MVKINASTNRIGEAACLLENLFLHEMFVLAFDRAYRVVGNMMDFRLKHFALQILDAIATRFNDSHLATFEENHVTCVHMNGGNITGNEHLIITNAQDDTTSIANPHSNKRIG